MGEQVATETPLVSLIAGLADNKYFLGKRYAEWCTAAPTLESAVAAAAMAQDEIGHARSFYPLLREVSGDSMEADAEERTAYTNAPFLNEPFESWCDFVAANFLFDTAITVLLESAVTSAVNDLAQRARRILEEEPLHWLHGEGWTRRLPSKGPAVREQLAQSLNRVGLEALAWFDLADRSLVEGRILDKDPDQLRAVYREQVNPVLSSVGLPTV